MFFLNIQLISIEVLIQKNKMCECILFFYENSSDKYPGEGSNEQSCPSCDYTNLSQIKNWRFMLSKYYKSIFADTNGKDWESYEHFYQCNKFFIDHEYSYEHCYKIFKNLTPYECTNISFSKKEYKNIIELGLKYKFQYNNKLLNVLVETGTAKLVHRYDPNIGPMLEKIRKNLQKK
jgi:predicted NAD-dependent protein-ADP-ribosyltransferase YbiA (DUF1768 family)